MVLSKLTLKIKCISAHKFKLNTLNLKNVDILSKCKFKTSFSQD